jgi:hypothetical protein
MDVEEFFLKLPGTWQTRTQETSAVRQQEVCAHAGKTGKKIALKYTHECLPTAKSSA